MGLPAGTRLGRYEIQAMLGVGGMGEVYRARDSRLNRDVAIKVLPDSVSVDPERLARLQREARTLASLNHPHIAAIYDVEDAGGTSGLVLELVDGPTLADRLRSGPLPESEALAIAAQIADALAAAHDKGIIHRDLKPANIKLTAAGVVKVLDFGLAKAFDQRLLTGVDAGSTISAPAGMTAAGSVLGTPAYMSPEQARGEALDRRTDIWSFGVVLYEMVTGRRPFSGHTTSDILAAVLKEEPEWEGVPTRVRRLLRWCLQKDPQWRLRDVGDAIALLDEPSQPAPLSRRGRSMHWAWPVAAALVLVTIVALFVARRGAAPAPVPVRFQIALPGAVALDAPILSPDGRSLVFLGRTSDAPDRVRVWLHSLDLGESRQLFQAEKFAGTPFWSPDSRSVAFIADGQLNRLDAAGGTPRALCEVRGFSGTGSWNRDDVILFSSNVVMRIAASGGTPVPLTALDVSRKEIGHFLPRFLPDGRHFLYLRVSPTTDESGIYVGSIDARPEEQQNTRLVATRGGPIYVPGGPDRDGHLLFLRGRTLLAQRLDTERLELRGDAFRVADQVGFADVPSNRYAHASVSDTGVLAYRLRETATGLLVWVNRTGGEEGPVIADPLPDPQNPRLSPDGNRLAVMLAGNLWVYDLKGRPPLKLSFDGSSDIPLWAADGARLVYASNASPTRLLSVSSANSGDTAQQVSPPGHYHPHGWSADGRAMIAVVNTYSPTNWDIVALPVQPPGDVQAILNTPSAEGIAGAALSPDGRWLAYTSNVTGTPEIWVRPYPGPGAAPVRVSAHGGADPLWARDGRELYYLEGRKMMAVAVSTAGTFEYSPAIVLFTSKYLHPANSPLTYDVAADGRFVMLKSVEEKPAVQPINVVLNWTANLPH